MGLILYEDGKGALRPTWWGRVIYKGKAHETNLNVPIQGTPPVDANGKVALSLTGDEAFERSRKAATRALEAWRKETRTNPAELQEKAYKAHTNVSLAGVPLPKLIEKWQGLKRQRQPTPERIRNARVTFQRFATFARTFAEKNGKRCDTLNDITPEMAAAWFDEIKDTFAWGTVKDMMHLMSGAFRRWANNGQPNPFTGVVLRGSKEVGEEKKRTERKALTADQFARLLECSLDDERLHPLIVCAAYTGMRIGDVCRLTCADVDLTNGTIDCITAKAGVRVNIPILSPELREVLAERCTVSGDGSPCSPYVFPWAAQQYAKNRTAIVRGVKPYFARAVFGDKPQPEPEEAHLIEAPTPAGIEAAADAAGFSETKRNRVVEVYNRFKAGETYNCIAAALHVARGQVSAYLKDAERLTGENLRPRAKRDGNTAVVDLLEYTRVERKIGKYAASVWGWHNLRHHFITCALNAGVPVHKVAAIVGHQVTAITTGYADMRTDAGMQGGGPAPLPNHAVVSTGTAGTDAARALALTRAVIPSGEAATVAAVIRAAGVDADKEPERALALIGPAVTSETRARIAAVLKAAN